MATECLCVVERPGLRLGRRVEFTIRRSAEDSGGRDRCPCWVCTAHRAHEALGHALAEAVESGESRDMDLSFLRDEVAAVAASRIPFPGRRRLRAALKAVG